MKTFPTVYFLLPLLALCLFFLYRSADFPPHDFANYYFGAKLLAEGHFGNWVYFPYEFSRSIALDGHPNIFASYAPNTPFLALALLPLSFFPLLTAKLVFNAIGILMLLYTLRRLVRHYKIDPAYLLLVPVLFFVPIKNQLLFGQVYFLLFFLIGESWLAYKKNKTFKMAVFMALAICLKLFPVLLVLVLVFRKKFVEAGSVVVCCGVFVAASVVVNGWEIWAFFLIEVLPKAAQGEISEPFVRNYQSVLMFLKEMLVYDTIQNPQPVLNHEALFSGLLMGFKILLVAMGYEVSRKVKMPLVALSYWILAMVLLSPYGSTYTFVLLLIPMLALAKNPIAFWKKTTGFALIFVVCNVPIAWIETFEFPFCYVRLMALMLLFALVLLLVYQKIRLRNVALVTAVPMVLVLMFTPEPMLKSETVLDKETPILIYDFTLSDQTLTYWFWDENGANKRIFAFAFKNAELLLLHENQVFRDGNPLTFDKNNKRKPVLVDGHILLYLSDEGRGIGFYTLRRMLIK